MSSERDMHEERKMGERKIRCIEFIFFSSIFLSSPLFSVNLSHSCFIAFAHAQLLTIHSAVNPRQHTRLLCAVNICIELMYEIELNACAA